MKALILAAGYATRLYPLTKSQPKPLLPIAGRPILEYILEKLNLTGLREVLVVTNHKFYPNFVDWVKKSQWHNRVKIINDETTSDEGKLGAVGDINLVLEREGKDDDMLIVGGDNLFSFSLTDFVVFARQIKPAHTIGLYQVKDIEVVKRCSVVELNNEKRVVKFEEKPKEPRSNLISVCLYYLPGEKLGRIAEYLNAGKNPDAPGYYISWLCQNDEVFGFPFTGSWFDIGDLRSYKEADEIYRKNLNGWIGETV